MKVKIYVLAACLMLILTALFGLLYSFFTSDHSPQAQNSPPHLIPNTDVNPFGANFFLDREVEEWKREKTVRMASEAGIGWAKQQFRWAEIEPQRKSEFVDPLSKESSWKKYDSIVELCEKYGLQIIARLDRPPIWAHGDTLHPERPPLNFEDYGDFVYVFVERYKGRVKYIQIWNEPNIYPEWGNRPVDPEEYVELLKIAYLRAKEADPNVYVLSAPLAITLGEPATEPGRWRSMNDLEFLEKMYQAGAKDYFDILSANAFGMDSPPDAPPDPKVLNFSRVLLQRQIMEKYGDEDKPIWFNEYGWNAAPSDFPEEKLIWKRVDEELQARYTLLGIEMARREWPWAGVFNIWYFRHVGDLSPDSADYYFRMVDVDFTPRRVYYAVKDSVVAMGEAGPGFFQETNPAVSIGKGWEDIIEPHASAKSCIISDLDGASLTFTFRGDSVSLLTQRSPQAGRLYVTLDGHVVDGLERDEEGRSYIDLRAPSPQWQVEMPLVRGGGNGRHVLRLTVGGEGGKTAPCVVDGFRVEAAPPPPFPYLPLSTLTFGAAVVAIWLYLEIRR